MSRCSPCSDGMSPTRFFSVKASHHSYYICQTTIETRRPLHHRRIMGNRSRRRRQRDFLPLGDGSLRSLQRCRGVQHDRSKKVLKSRTTKWLGLHILLRPFVRLWRHRKNLSDASSTPERTALMSFEESSVMHEQTLRRGWFRRGCPPTEDDDSQHFSISTDLQQPSFRKNNAGIHITISNSFNSYVPPPPPPTERVSLETFMANTTATTSHTAMIPLEDATITGSLTSALLGVSYDEDYPQLVMQSPSVSTTTTGGSATGLGAQGGHPFWWGQRTQQQPLDWWDAAEQDESSSSSVIPEPPMTMSEWMDEAEFSIGESVRSLSELIEKDLVQPVMDFCSRTSTVEESPPAPRKRKVLFRIIKRR